MKEKFDVKKLLSGLKFWQGAHLGKIIFVFVIASFVISLALGVYHKLTQRTTSTTIRKIEAGGQVFINEPIEEKLWETNLNAGYGAYDEKPIWLGWIGIKRKF